MPFSYAVYTGNGSTTQFSVTFPYIRREHVVASLDYVSQAFTWVNNTTISISPAPANGVRVEVRRVTPVNAPLVDFVDGSTLVAADLDTNTLQQTYINQEQDDDFEDTISINAQGLLDAGGQRLTNLGNPTSAQDAATKTYVDSFVSQTANIANGAVTTAKLADSSVTSAKIVDGTIVAADLASDAVTTAKILDANVTTAKLADNSVTTGKIAAGAVTDAKLASGIDGAKLTAGSVATAALADADLQTLAGAQAGAATAFAALTAAEVATLDGITSSTAELNVLDGVTADVTEINKLDGLTSSTSELNQLAGKTISGTLTPGNTNDIPTSSAVNSWVSNLINALGGFVAIANRNSFPTENPDPSDNAGTVVSIADAGGLIVSAGGTATNAQTTGAVAVTITGFPAAYQSKTLNAGLGIQVQTTTTLNTYTFHKSIPTDADIAQLSDDVNDFFARYRVGTTNPTTDLDAGDLFFNTSTGKMLVYDGTTSSWEEVQSIGNFNINTLSSSAGTGGGSASFNGTAYRFTLSNPPLFAQQLLVSVNGVMQKPNSGTSQPAEGFAIDGNDIVFSQAPATSSPFFIVTMGSTVNIGTPSDGTVTTAKLADSAVTTAKIDNGAVTAAKLAANLTVDLAPGSAASPSLYFDANTGLYSPGEDQVAVATNGAGRLFVDSTGRVGVNTSSPTTIASRVIHVAAGAGESSALRLTGNAGTGLDFIQALNGDGFIYQRDNSPLIFGTNNLERLRITSAGLVGIGTTPTSIFHVKAATNRNFKIDSAGGGGGDLRISALNDADSANVNLQIQGDQLFFAAGGAERARIDSSGRLLVGTSSSAGVSRLTVRGNTNTNDGVFEVGHALGYASISSGDSVGIVRFSEATNSGIYAQIVAQADGASGNNDYPGRLVFSTTADGASSPTEAARIDSAGRVTFSYNSIAGVINDWGYGGYRGLSANTNSTALADQKASWFLRGSLQGTNSEGGNCILLLQDSGGAATNKGDLIKGYTGTTFNFRVANNGGVTNTPNTYGAISDERLKQDIEDAQSQWDDIKQIQVRKFRFRNAPESAPYIGVIAQELEAVSPGLIDQALLEDGSPDPDSYKSVKYSVLYMKAIKALQEAMERIEQLEAKVAALEAQ